jgi:N-acetylmuramoyl-L-alanine amidase
MIKFYSLILSLLTFIIFATPAYAGRLLFWRFESNQNRLLFTTDQGVQPTAQLLSNPTRLAIDLPGTTLGRPSITENLGNIITNLRIGQFDARTTRVVIELAPGYTLDPQGIKIKGLSPTQWSVNLPQPQRVNFPSQSSPDNSISPDNQSRNNNNNPIVKNNVNSSNGLQVTSSGIIVDIDGNHKNTIKVNRSRDRRQINFEIDNLTLPNNLPNSWSVNQYGISNLQLNQSTKSVALLTLNVNPDSPDWQGSFSRMGGLVLWPQGGISRVVDLSLENTNNSDPKISNSLNTSPNPQPLPLLNRSNPPLNSSKTSIESIEVNYNQLMIRANQSLKAQGSWTQGNSIYQIRLENTDLSPNFKSPNLPSGSPIARMRIWQPDNNTVILLIEPASTVKIGILNQPSERILSLSLNRGNKTSWNTQNNTSSGASLPISQPQTDPFNYTPGNNSLPSSSPGNNFFPINNSRPSNNRPPNRGKTLVIIDPGHGGKDVGAVGIGSIQEKNIVLSISQQVASILERQGIQVRMTRDSDYFISLEGRSNMANRLNADIFVSIHANSAGASKPAVSGYETYYYQNGRALADIIHRNVIRRVDVRDRKIKQARFYVLRKSNMPSVLLETGFVTGSEDAAKLTNSNFQQQMAEAIAAGIVEYIQVNRI